MAIGDLNGDLAPDIAIASGSSNWVLFYNDSKPYISDSIQIPIPNRVDTVVHTYTINDTTIIESNDSFQVMRIDTYLITDSIHYRYGYNYLFYIREGEICSGYYLDSLVSDSTYFWDQIVFSDTLFISSEYDTIDVVNINFYLDYGQNIQIFPNPAHGKITIQMNIPEMDEIILYLYNELGQLILCKEIIAGDNLIDLN